MTPGIPDGHVAALIPGDDELRGREALRRRPHEAHRPRERHVQQPRLRARYRLCFCHYGKQGDTLPWGESNITWVSSDPCSPAHLPQCPGRPYSARMRRVALAVALLLSACSSSYETRTLVQEADGGVTENPVVEGDAGTEAGQPDTRPPPPLDLCHWKDAGTPYLGQGCYITIADGLANEGTWSGQSCWVDDVWEGVCGCQRVITPPHIPCQPMGDGGG
jgi:hypothetical protein